MIVPTRELCVQVTQDLENASKYLKSGEKKLEGPSIYGGRAVRAADRRAPQGRRRRRRYPGPPARPRQPGSPDPRKVGVPGPRRGRRDARPRVPSRHRAHPRHAAWPDKRQTMLFSATMPGPIITLARTFLTQPDAHPRRGGGLVRRPRADHAAHLPRPRTRQGRDGGPRPAGRRPRRDDDLHPHQAHRAEGRRRPERARFQRRCRARRPRPDRPREGARRLPQRQGRRPGSHRRRGPRHRHRRRHARHHITTSARKTRRPTCTASAARVSRRSHRYRDHARGLGRRPPLAADRQGSGSRCPDPVETYSSSPHLYEDLGIPTDAKGSIRKPRAERPAKEHKDAPAAEKSEKSDAPKRSRRRTRGGKATDGSASAAATATSGEKTPEVASSTTDEAGPAPRRRRRRRRPASAEGAPAQTDSQPVSVTAAAE